MIWLSIDSILAQISFGAPVSVCFRSQGATKYTFHLDGRHGGGSVK